MSSESDRDGDMIGHAGLRIKIMQDEGAESPDSFGNDDLFLVGFHREFHVTRPKSGLGKPDDAWGWIEKNRETYHVFPLHAYIHSGVLLSLGSDFPFDPGRWDTSHLGFVFVAREWWKEEKEAREGAESLASEWNQYLSGDVWGFSIEMEDGTHLDSCWGFYGREYCEEEARGAAESCAKSLLEEDEKIQRVMAL